MRNHPTNFYFHSSEAMTEVPDNSVTLVVSSPPYNVDKEYEKGMSYDEWKKLIKSVMQECYRVLIDGGRICINIASTGRHPYIPLYCDIINIAGQLGFIMRATFIWLKGHGAESSWGSYGLASDPIIRDAHEFILAFHKGTGKIPKGVSGIAPEEYVEFTRAEWKFRSETRLIGHPAPFPDELPRRCILLYSNEGDTVLDPFAGSGTVYKVAQALHRVPISYEQDISYLPIIQQRIREPLQVQSEAWDLHQHIKKTYPELYTLSTRQLRSVALEKYGKTLSQSLNKYELLIEVGQLFQERKVQKNLTSFFPIKNK